jgi:hypothetical protein
MVIPPILEKRDSSAEFVTKHSDYDGIIPLKSVLPMSCHKVISINGVKTSALLTNL